MNAVASMKLKPTCRMRPPSPATNPLKSSEAVPGSLIQTAVAMLSVKPIRRLRPPSPASDSLKSTHGVPGSPFKENENEARSF